MPRPPSPPLSQEEFDLAFERARPKDAQGQPLELDDPAAGTLARLIAEDELGRAHDPHDPHELGHQRAQLALAKGLGLALALLFLALLLRRLGQ